MANTLSLGSFTVGINHVQKVRDLTADEIVTNERFVGIYTDAAARLKLFRVLSLNYEAWSKFTNSLLSANADTADDMLRADQLLLNFLSTAYAITEHFRLTVEQRFKKDQSRVKQYRDFLVRMYEGSWAFAFFTDFRDYAQHIGLPVGRYNRTYSRTMVEITIAQDSATLVAESPRSWRRCNLSADRGEIDLISLSWEYYLYLKRDYAKYVADFFYPELVQVQEFYSALAAEATVGGSNKRMLFISQAIEEGNEGTFSFIEPPNDPMKEIGILIERPAPK